MTVLQLVRTSDGSRIEPVLNPEQKDQEQLEREGLDTVDAGSDLLLEFAHNLAHSGFRLLEIAMVDRYFSEVDLDDDDEELVRLRNLVREDLLVAKQFKQNEFPDLFVSFIKLLNTETSRIVTIGQEGVVHADQEDIKYISAGLNSA